MADAIERVHSYHAEATVLEGHLQLPVVQEIKPQAHLKIPEQGGYLSQRIENYRLEGAISFRSAYSQVAGNPDIKPGHGWSYAISVISLRWPRTCTSAVPRSACTSCSRR